MFAGSVVETTHGPRYNRTFTGTSSDLNHLFTFRLNRTAALMITTKLLTSLCCLLFLVSTGYSNERLPNVVVIMADDLGYGDVSCYGATELQTPNIDRLAAEGLRFTRGYCSASTCTPTRYSFLTGRYAFRKPGTGIAPPNGPAIIQPGVETLPSIMQKAGYKTAVIGKWHLGLGEKGKGPDWNGDLKPGPLEIGFDSCFLLPTTNDRVPQVYVQDHNVLNLDPKDPLWVGNKKPSEDHPTGKTHRDTLKMDWSHGHNSTIHNGISRIGFYTGGHAARFRDEDLADKWVEKTEEFVAANREEPFFLFFSSHDCHVPRMPHERFQGKTKLGFRGDAIVQLDWCVGEVMKSLEKHGLKENTMIIFCSDNGPVMDDGYQDDAIEKVGKHKAGGPYTGGKYSVYEGGCRTPFITHWPGTIKPGVSDEMVCTIDIAASMAAMTKQPLAEDACIDSFNLLGALTGSKDSFGRQSLILQDNGNKGNWSYIKLDGDKAWKLHRYDHQKAFNVVVEEKLKNTPKDKLEFYEINSDPQEKSKVAITSADAREMAAELQSIIDQGDTGKGTRPR